jgi:hypothetical protein
MSIPLPSAGPIEALATALDAATHDDRVAWLRALPPKELHVLWDQAEGRAVDVDHYTYPDEPGRVRIHEGRNTMALPPFRNFQKRFALQDGKIAGYNHGLGVLAWLVWFQGWGPFVCKPAESPPGEVWVDYRELPPQHPEFPPVRPNRWGGWIVYGGMIDAMRRVSRDVTIGVSASKAFPVGVGEKFALVRCP